MTEAGEAADMQRHLPLDKQLDDSTMPPAHTFITCSTWDCRLMSGHVASKLLQRFRGTNKCAQVMDGPARFSTAWLKS